MAILKRAGKRGTTYRVVVYVRGKQRWQTFKTLGEARTFEASARLGKVGAPTRQTFGEFLDQWFETAVQTSDREPGTVHNIEQAIAYAKKSIGDVPIKRLGPQDLQRMIGEWRTSLSPTTVHSYFGTIKMGLRRARQWRLITDDPLDGVERPKVPLPDVKAWDEEQAALFFGAAKRESPYYGLYYLAAHTGMRLGECLGLSWRQIDFARPAIMVSQQVQRGEVVATLKTVGSKKPISLAGQDGLIAYLMNLPRPFDLVFCRPDGKPINPGRVWEDMRTLCRVARVPLLSFKDLRHTHATLLAKHDVSMKVIQERLRHADPRTTLRFYTAALPAMHDAASRKIGEVLSE